MPGFWWRVAALAVVLALVALVERLRRGAAARRWREYAFLAFGAVTGAAFGIGIDQVTSRISPEYFLYGKGVSAEGFRSAVVDLGARAGGVAGTAIAGVLLVARSRLEARMGSPPELRWHLVIPPLAASAAGALAVGGLFALGTPGGMLEGYRAFLLPEQWRGFRIVAGAHYGLYLGGVAGTIAMVRRMRRRG